MTAAGRRSRRAAALALAACIAVAASAHAAPAEVLETREVAARRADGGRALELSDLAWDAAARRLWAVSDRGRLHHWTLPPGAEDLRALVAGAPRELPQRPNAEALALRPDGVLLAVDEADATVLEIGPEAVARTPLPAAMAPPAGARHGVEAAAWIAAHGLVVAAQQPAGGLHRVRAASGREWWLRPLAAAGSSLKAMSPLGADRLLLLEKLRADGRHRFVLRALALDCAGPSPCETEDWPLDDARLGPADNFEGLACTDDRHCLLVTDDGGSREERSLLVRVRLSRR